MLSPAVHLGRARGAGAVLGRVSRADYDRAVQANSHRAASTAGVDELVRRLRTAGCAFAEEEAAILQEAATGPEQLEQLTRRREAGAPLEAIVGWVSFGQLRLAVGPGVFIPRQRSLLLARVAVSIARHQEAPVLLEAFAGVAPIAATVIDALPGVEAHISDIDTHALEHGRRNVRDVAGTYCGDGLAALPASLADRITLLVAVPPYVPSDAAGFLPREAGEHEPSRALFAGIDGLDHIRDVVDTAGPWLAPDGRVLLEMNKAQYPAAAAHSRDTGFTARRHPGTDGQTVLLDLRRG